jgi:hypothetical protein
MQLVTIGIDDSTDGVHDCPKIMDDMDTGGGPIYVQGLQVTDEVALGQSRPGPG